MKNIIIILLGLILGAIITFNPRCNGYQQEDLEWQTYEEIND